MKGVVQVSYISVWAFKVINHKETGCGGHRVSERIKLNKEAESCQLDCFYFIISPITVVGVHLKATNSEVLILACKEDKDK